MKTSPVVEEPSRRKLVSVSEYRDHAVCCFVDTTSEQIEHFSVSLERLPTLRRYAEKGFHNLARSVARLWDGEA